MTNEYFYFQGQLLYFMDIVIIDLICIDRVQQASTMITRATTMVTQEKT
jgi:hypothetical protein